MEKPDKITLKEAIKEANSGTIKQRLARHKKRLLKKYGIKK